MKPYTPKTFQIPELKGISAKNIEEHLKLYAGYVKNTNLIMEQFQTNACETDAEKYSIYELGRRFSFEYNGMRNHELYFAQLEGGPRAPTDESAFKQAVVKQMGSFEGFVQGISFTALTRGVGWAILYWDAEAEQFLVGWTDEQHLGHLLGLTPIFALDMWEHSFVADYQPSGKKQYVEDYFANVNWGVVEERFAKLKTA